MNKTNLAVAVAQIESALGDLDANLRKHLDIIDAARVAGVEVLVFPELSLTGHSGGHDKRRLATGLDDRCIREIARASGKMCSVVGVIEEGAAAQFYNSAFAVRGGKVVFAHRKVNLATYGKLDDGKHFAPGTRIGTFEIGGPWRASVLICADSWNPPLVHLAAAQDATVLLAPVSSALEAVGAEFDNPGGWDANLRFHAMTYGLPIAMANRVGREGDLTFWGGSRIVDPFGRTVAIAAGDGEELVSATLDFVRVRRARELLPTMRDANLPLLHSELGRLLSVPSITDADRAADRGKETSRC